MSPTCDCSIPRSPTMRRAASMIRCAGSASATAAYPRPNEGTMTRSSWDPTSRSYGTSVWTLQREQPLERRLLGGIARIDVLVEQCRHDVTAHIAFERGETAPGPGAGAPARPRLPSTGSGEPRHM